MLSINNIQLSLPDYETDDETEVNEGKICLYEYKSIIRYIEQVISPSDLYTPFQLRGWPGFGLVGTAFPVNTRVLPPVKIGSFHWPRTASRWGYAHLLATSNQISQFQSAAWGDGGDQNNLVDLYIDCAGQQSQESIQAKMYILPPYPLFWSGPGNSGFNNYYLLTLVDARYYWQYTPCPDLGITTSGAKTWNTVISTLMSAVGETFSMSSINSAYLYPSIMLNLTGECITTVIDAALYNVGMYLARNFNGNSIIQTFDDAYQISQKDISNNPLRSIRAGGFLYQNTI